MTPEERLVITALHLAHWSYRRLSVILGLTIPQIAQLAWQTRLRLAAAIPQKRPLIYPSGTRDPGARCPNYEPSEPWTQKFLDDEMSGHERLFIQNHTMACPTCRRAVATCRDLYYAVDSILPIPRAEGVSSELIKTQKILESAWAKAYVLAHREGITVREAFWRFASRPQIWVPVVAVLVLLLTIR